MSNAKPENRPPTPGSMAGDTSSFSVGTRCRLSELGRSRSPKLAAKVGQVLRKARARNQIHLLFDGYSTPVTLHRTYVEAISPEEEPPQGPGSHGSSHGTDSCD